jgi:hypothetical protein
MVYGWNAGRVSIHRKKAMPRILPTFAAVIIVGVCIAINTMRYPIVWQMVGPTAQVSLSEKVAPAAEVPAPAKAVASSTAAEKPPETPSVPPKTDSPWTGEEREKPALPAAVPIALAPEEVASVDVKRNVEKAAKPETDKVPPSEENLVEPPRRLVPVASDPFSAGAPLPRAEEIGRLPPVEAEVAFPAERYTAEYTQAGVPIYPSTGK